MAKRSATMPETYELVAEIDRYEQTYYISEHRGEERLVSDEVLIELYGRIVRTHPKQKQHLDQAIEITFGCAVSYETKGRTPQSDKPFLLPMNLRKSRRSFMAYLPAAVFWSVPAMIDGKRLTHIQAHFDRPSYGSADMLGVYLMPESKFSVLAAGQQ